MIYAYKESHIHIIMCKSELPLIKLDLIHVRQIVPPLKAFYS